jgi:preprotein translocase subunit YajC
MTALFSWLALFAESDAQQPQGAPTWTLLMYALPLLLVFMFLRSGARQKREMQKALSAMKKGDKVVTSGGILGVIVAVKENEHADSRAEKLRCPDHVGRPGRRRNQIPMTPPRAA